MKQRTIERALTELLDNLCLKAYNEFIDYSILKQLICVFAVFHFQTKAGSPSLFSENREGFYFCIYN